MDLNLVRLFAVVGISTLSCVYRKIPAVVPHRRPPASPPSAYSAYQDARWSSSCYVP